MNTTDVERSLHRLWERIFALEDGRAGPCTHPHGEETSNVPGTSDITQREKVNSLRETVVALTAKVQQHELELATLRDETAQKQHLHDLEMATLKSTLKELLSERKKESYYQKLMEEKLNAKRMKVPGVGMTDLTNDEAHIEIKNWIYYDDVPGQLAKYHQVIPRKKSVVYYFGRRPRKQRLDQILQLMFNAGIEVYSFDVDDVIERHLPTQDGEESKVHRFIQEHMARTDNMSEFALWTEVFKLYREKFDGNAKRDPLRKELAKYGVLYKDSSLNAVTFKGFKNWRLVETAEDTLPSDLSSG